MSAGHPAFSVSEIEASRPGPHYSFETLEEVRRERPGDELFFLIGADSLVDLPTWRQPEAIARMATIVVVNRPGIDVNPIARDVLPNFGVEAKPLRAVEIPTVGISSKNLRTSMAERRSVRFLVPRGVEAYIEAQGLYHPLPVKRS